MVTVVFARLMPVLRVAAVADTRGLRDVKMLTEAHFMAAQMVPAPERVDRDSELIRDVDQRVSVAHAINGSPAFACALREQSE